MARKGRSTINQENAVRYRIHVECVRRNPIYQLAYDRAMKYTPSEAFMPIRALQSAWRLCYEEAPPNPYERPSLDDVIHKTKGFSDPIYLPGDMAIGERVGRVFDEFSSVRLSDLKLKPKIMAGMAVLLHFPEDRPENTQWTVFDTRSSKNSLMEQFGDWVNTVHTQHAQRGVKIDAPAQRIHLQTSWDYLKAYDMRAEGKSYKDIGNLMWKGHQGDLKKKARDYVESGETLVSRPPLIRSKPNRLSKLDDMSKKRKGE
jgi:hypothetical protein